MYFTKQPHPANFEFASQVAGNLQTAVIGDSEFELTVREYEGQVYNVVFSKKGLWTESLCIDPVVAPQPVALGKGLELSASGSLTLKDATGNKILESDPRGFFGVMGEASMFCFRYHPDQRFFGLGEKTFPTIEHKHRRTRFWNVDVLGDFNGAQWDNQPLDPYYASVPYLIVEANGAYVGLLLHNPYATFIDCGSDASFFGNEDENRRVVLGSEGGLPDLWILVGPTLAELTAKLQKLVGGVSVPPLWGLGYHQCRWGYRGEKDMLGIAQNMDKHGIPGDGTWLDIDYMNQFRVFTYAKEHWPNGPEKGVKALNALGKHVVPIIDPGVKLDENYEVYQSGKKADIFCKNPQGKEYVGFVWPGLTVFPDFSMAEGRAWWRKYAAEFRKVGFSGAWLDMNDPSTGAIDPMAMRFGRGKYPHEAFHNQYALGMQKATHEGFLDAEPDKRVFLVSRSGFTGSNKYAAIWTGDNLSSRWYLKNTIPCAISMSLSGLPWGGPDVGGFMNDTTEPLMTDWVQAGFLFPFFRIHSGHFNRAQEPWTFSKTGLKLIRRYISLRYRLMPYLYNLFVQLEETGHPVIRPVIYHYEEKVPSSDQFLVGEDILQAPQLDEGKGRAVVLPGKSPWFDARTGEWVRPGKRAVERGNAEDSPVYFRNGAIVPTRTEADHVTETDLTKVQFHVFLKSGSAEYVYHADDGETFEYKKGKRSTVKINARASGSSLSITTESISEGFGPIEFSFVVYGEWTSVRVNGKKVRTRKGSVQWTGSKITCSNI
jgi:alpha-glucosidase